MLEFVGNPVDSIHERRAHGALRLLDQCGDRLQVSYAPQPIVDVPQLDAGEIECILRGANLWLTPDVVAGFDEKDFSFLPEAEKTVPGETRDGIPPGSVKREPDYPHAERRP